MSFYFINLPSERVAFFIFRYGLMGVERRNSARKIYEEKKMTKNFIYRKNNLSNSSGILAILTLALLLGGVFLAKARAAAGDLDSMFGVGGRVTTNFKEADNASAVVVQPDGKIVAAGTASDFSFIGEYFALARYNADGTPDAGFGVGGKVTTDFFNNTFSVDVALQTDGKIVVVGSVAGGSGTSDFGIIRYNADGTPDASFGAGGKVTLDFYGDADGATAVTIQTDGKIVVAGRSKNGGNPSDFALARLNMLDGTPDGGFGAGGKVSIDFAGGADRAEDVAIQTDGKIVVAGTASGADFGVVRRNGDGTPDAGFGAGGKTTTDFNGTQDAAEAIAVQTDGKIVVGGRANSTGVTADFGLVRYDSTGTPDASFGAGGKRTTDFFGSVEIINDIVLQPDGKIVAVGLVNLGGTDIDFGVARYNTDGTPDAGFGFGGKVTTAFTESEAAQAVALQADCKIVVAGFSNPPNTSDSLFAVARYDGGTCAAAPPATCPKGHGFWKNHPNAWAVNSLTLGNQIYTKAELLALLSDPTKGDASIVLARQFIAAKLNLASGSAAAPISSTITHADGILSNFAGKLPYKVKSSSAAGQQMTADAGVLDNYNNGLLTPVCAP